LDIPGITASQYCKEQRTQFLGLVLCQPVLLVDYIVHSLVYERPKYSQFSASSINNSKI
jgi:hypothetical protein